MSKQEFLARGGWVPDSPNPKDFLLSESIEADKGRSDFTSTGKKSWGNPSGWIGSQGDSSACGGFAGTVLLNREPKLHTFRDSYAFGLWREATTLDNINGDWQTGQWGTNLRGVLRALKRRGEIGSYGFTRSLEETVIWLLNKGPVLLCCDWHSGMNHLDANGFARVTGTVKFGHFICLYAVSYQAGDPIEDHFEFQNSWGRGYGRDGTGKLAVEGFHRLAARSNFLVGTALEL